MAIWLEAIGKDGRQANTQIKKVSDRFLVLEVKSRWIRTEILDKSGLDKSLLIRELMNVIGSDLRHKHGNSGAKSCIGIDAHYGLKGVDPLFIIGQL